MVFKSVNLSKKAIDRIENYRRNCEGKIPSFSKVVDQIILCSELLTIRNGKEEEQRIKDEEAQAEQEAYLAQEEPENYYSDAEYED